MSNDIQEKIETLLIEIDTLSNLGITLADSTSTPAGDIAVLFTVIKEKSEWLYDQLNDIKGTVRTVPR